MARSIQQLGILVKLNVWNFIILEDGDTENRLTLSGDEAEEDGDQQDEQWRVERLEREKWMQGTLPLAASQMLHAVL